MGIIKNKNRVTYIFLPALLILAALLFTGCTATGELEIPDEYANLYNDALTSPLERAIAETDDAELASFSQKLLEGYKLSELKDNTGDGTSSIASLLPDITYINKIAMETTLIEAGKTLQDPELSEFYSSFIKRIGVDN